MDHPYSGFVLDPSKCRNLSIKEKRELVHELSKWPETAPEKLQTWSRRDLLEILCAEMGKERKYTGATKQKLIEQLFRVITQKNSGKRTEDIDPNPQLAPTPFKRQRKTDHPSRLPIEASNHSVDDGDQAPKNIRYCDNLVCRATLSVESVFCKRCTCGICYKYDENKDPSLWLVCNSDYPYQGDSCGISYHAECVLKHERAGVVKNGKCTRLDGSYYCIHCQKVNDLLLCWRKQLMFVKDARRVDTLCQRISLSHKILKSTEKYQSLHEIVDMAKSKLESEVGPLNDLSNMARGIVNRLAVGAEVQRLCARAVELRDLMFSSGLLYQSKLPCFPASPMIPSSCIKFEDVTSTSLILVVGTEDNTQFPQELLGYTLWHRKADSKDYPPEQTGTLHLPMRKFRVTNLCPSTEYFFKVIAFSNTGELGNWEIPVKTEASIDNVPKSGGNQKTNSSLSNPSAEGDESNNTPDSYSGDFQENPEIRNPVKDDMPMNSDSGLDEDSNPTIHEVQNQTLDVPKSDNESNTPATSELMAVAATLPVTPSRLEAEKPDPSCNSLENDPSKPEKEPGSSSKKRSSGGKCDKVFTKDGSSSMEGDYEYCVKVIRWLECEGHIETSFRVKFLTWFSLRASLQERRIVSVYVDTLIDDPGSLAGQLMDTFSEAVSSKRPPPVPAGFCMRLWH